MTDARRTELSPLKVNQPEMEAVCPVIIGLVKARYVCHKDWALSELLRRGVEV